MVTFLFLYMRSKPKEVNCQQSHNEPDRLSVNMRARFTAMWSSRDFMWKGEINVIQIIQ